MKDVFGINHKGTKTRRGLIALCLCVLVVCSFSSFRGTRAQPNTDAQSNLHQWGAVTLFHGLPSDHVNAIAQDPDGAMWFGTDSGLARYDGRRVQKLATDGPAAARVSVLKLDREGVLWIGSDAGAARLINGEIKPIADTHGSVITAIITPEAGRALMTSQQGEIFDCATARDGSLLTHKISSESHPLLTIEARGHAPVQLTSLALVDGTLLVGTHSRGLLAIDAAHLKAGAAPTANLIKELLSRPRAFFVEAIETDSRGRVWFGADTSAEDSGLYDASDLTHPEKIGAGVGKVTALAFDQSGDLWAGSEARGVFVYREGQRLEHFTFENTAGGLRSNQIHSVFIDREGVAWFATDRGVSRFDPGGLRVEAISGEPESNVARVLFRSSDSTLWCGTNRGLFTRVSAHIFAQGDAAWQEVAGFKGRIIHSIGEDQSGRLLIGTASGLFASEKKPKEPKSPRQFVRIDGAPGASDNIRSIATFQGSVYIANFDRGVERLDSSKRTLVWPDDSSDPRAKQVVSLQAERDERGKLWIGTAGAGVFSFDGKRATVDHSLDELIGTSVWSIEGAGDAVLWLATARGLYAFKSGALERVIEGVDARCVVPATKISSQSSSGKAVWCATVGGGVYKVLPGSAGISPTSALTSRIDTEQGLPSQNAFCLLTDRGQSADDDFWIGTSRGVARYRPGLVAPVLNVTRVMGKRIFLAEELSQGLKLEYPQNSLALEVAANSSRTFAEEFQYSFSVVDQKGGLVRQKLSHDSQLLLENLRPGNYRVEARAYTRDLVASEPIRFEFNVARAPFPWTSTALSVLLLLALVAMWWGYRQNKRLVGTNVALAETRMQLANETETERRRIARDLHDQTLSDLRRLMLLTDQLPANESSNGHVEPSKIRAEIESVSTEIRRICEDLSPSALANVGLGAALEWALADAVGHQPAEKRFEYAFVCDPRVDERLKINSASQIQIYRIVQEAISNVCRHSGATHVKLSLVIESDGALLIELEDNGRGFDVNRLAKKGRGLTNMRSRASLIGASLTWAECPNGGTFFVLRKASTAKRELF